MSRKIGEIWGTQFLLPDGAVIRKQINRDIACEVLSPRAPSL